MVTQIAGTRIFAVEVSGWDSARNFFVEKCELAWSEEQGKQISLSQDLREKTIVFVRLLQPGIAELAHPVAYEVEAVGASHHASRQFRLKMVAPRPKALDVPAA